MDDLQSILNKHVAFWNQTPTNEPLIQRLNVADWKPKPYPIKGGKQIVDPTLIDADDVDIDRLLGLDQPPVAPTDGYKVNCQGCRYSEAWMEALVGCPIYASAFSCTARRAESTSFEIDNAQRSPWAQVLASLLTRAQQVAGNRIPVRQPHLRGVIDVLAAYLGEDELCLALHDDPVRIEQLAAKCVNLFIAVVKRGFEIIHPWNGGYVSPWGVYAPGPLLDYQADASNMVSPQQYAGSMLGFDEAVISRFPYSLFHVHACGVHIVENLLKIENLKAIEISLDRETGSFDLGTIIQVCISVQERCKSILIYGQLDENELQELRTHLNPSGLAVFYW